MVVNGGSQRKDVAMEPDGQLRGDVECCGLREGLRKVERYVDVFPGGWWVVGKMVVLGGYRLAVHGVYVALSILLFVIFANYFSF